ncbi:MAG: hypothetical protein U1E86_24790 [Burkholderiaceae bacterium]
MPALEDKIVQRASASLGAIYEQDFIGFSYGFGAEARRALDAVPGDGEEGELDTDAESASSSTPSNTTG